jgi:hypothetical protein
MRISKASRQPHVSRNNIKFFRQKMLFGNQIFVIYFFFISISIYCAFFKCLQKPMKITVKFSFPYIKMEKKKREKCTTKKNVSCFFHTQVHPTFVKMLLLIYNRAFVHVRVIKPLGNHI